MIATKWEESNLIPSDYFNIPMVVSNVMDAPIFLLICRTFLTMS